MAMLNIGGENAGDAFYRYKMPKLQCRIEGRGNGIKTNVINNVDIAKALERPPEYVLKFFGSELGAQTKFDKKSGTSIVNGAHDASKLAEVLESFIKKYVQCYSCGNPETVIKIKKENIMLKCKACGFVSEVDPRLRFNSFIVKNPPENKLSKAEKKVKKAEKERLKGLEADGTDEKKDKKSKKEKKSKKSKENGHAAGESGEEEANGKEAAEETKNAMMEDNEDDEDDDDDGIVWMTDTSEEAMKRRAAEQLSAATAAMVTQGNVEAEREAAKKREEKRLAEEAAAQAKAEEEARLAAEAAEKLAIENPSLALRQALEKGEASSTTISEQKEIVSDALKNVEGGIAQRMKVLYTALFGDLGEGARLASAVKSKSQLLMSYAQDPAGQLAQLVAMEHLLSSTLSDRLREAPLVLKVLYDEDLADEGLIMAWYRKKDAAAVLGVSNEDGEKVRNAVQKFIEWLEEAESDESSDDE